MQISYFICAFDAQNLIHHSLRCGHAYTHQIPSLYVLWNLRYCVVMLMTRMHWLVAICSSYFSNQGDKQVRG